MRLYCILFRLKIIIHLLFTAVTLQGEEGECSGGKQSQSVQKGDKGVKHRDEVVEGKSKFKDCILNFCIKK